MKKHEQSTANLRRMDEFTSCNPMKKDDSKKNKWRKIGIEKRGRDRLGLDTVVLS